MITDIRNDVVYFYVNGEFVRAYDTQADLQQAIASLEAGSSYKLFTPNMEWIMEGKK